MADDLAYIRQQYGVPAWKGRQITVDGIRGVIVGARDVRLLVRFEPDSRPVTAHPTWRIDYEPDGGTDG